MDILETLLSEWSDSKTFDAQLLTLGENPVDVKVTRMSWAERKQVFTSDDPNLALLKEIPSRVVLADSGQPIFKDDGETDLVDILQNKINPAVTKELLDVVLTEEHDITNTKN